jgi:hypothetical protein
MKSIFYLKEYQSAAFCATYTRLLRWLRGFSPPLIYNHHLYTIASRFSGINSLQQTFGSGSFTIVVPFFCVISLRVYQLLGCIYLAISPIGSYVFSTIKTCINPVLLTTTNSHETIFKIQLLNQLKKIP